MAQVQIKGHSIFRKEIKSAGEFFSDYLLGKRLSKNVILNINLVKNLSSDRGRMLGECVPLDKYTRSRAFQICLKADLSHKKMILTLAHEVVHLKQFARGELSSGRYPVMKFLGDLYTEKENDYHLAPYEVEASIREKVLYDLWLEHKKTH